MAIETNRTEGENTNHLIVRNCVLTEEEVADYLGKELKSIPGVTWEPNKTYSIYRPLEELEKAQDTVNGLQLLDTHIPVDSKKLELKYTLGAVGTDCYIEDGKLKSTVTVWKQDAIDEIKAADINPSKGKKRLSLGYDYNLIPEQGVFNGKPYQFRMVDLVGNHLALVEKGRAPNAIIADSNINLEKGKRMSNLKTGFRNLVNLAFDKKARDSMDPKDCAKAIMDIARDENGAYEGKEDDQIDAILKAAAELNSVQRKESESSAVAQDAEEDNEKVKIDKTDAKEDAEKADKEESESKEDKDKKAMDSQLAMDAAIDKRVQVELEKRRNIELLCTKVMGKLSPQFLMDNSLEQVINKTLQTKGLDIENSTFETKLTQLKTLAEIQKPYLHDSKPVSRSTDSATGLGYNSFFSGAK